MQLIYMSSASTAYVQSIVYVDRLQVHTKIQIMNYEVEGNIESGCLITLLCAFSIQIKPSRMRS